METGNGRQARFVIDVRTGLTGRRWRWNLVAPNGEVVATSESYRSFAAACGGIEAVRAYGTAARVEVRDPR